MITSDWHIHSRNSCDAASLTVADLRREAADQGLTAVGLTDHLHTPFNLPDIVTSRREYDLAESPSAESAGFAVCHFGIEASCMSQWELDEIATGRYAAPIYGLREGGPPGGPLAIGITAEDIARYGIEYVVGGAHWPMYVPLEREAVIRDYHRQNMFLATHPLVTIVAHPWWWHGHWKDAEGRFTGEPWLDDFGRIPPSMHEEFAAALRERGKVAEINLSSMLLTPRYSEAFKRQYLDYLAGLQAAGVRLSLGSDCHKAHYHEIDFATAETMLAGVGLRDEHLWRRGETARHS